MINIFDFGEQNVTVLDASGLSCPLPLLKAKQQLNKMQSGQLLQVTTTDVGSVRDFRVFSEQSGNILIEFKEVDHQYYFLLKKI